MWREEGRDFVEGGRDFVEYRAFIEKVLGRIGLEVLKVRMQG